MDAKQKLEPGDIILDFIRNLLTFERASVIIPCYNEESTLGAVIAECLKSHIVSEVIVVDDGSTDGSAKVARESRARLVRHAKNKGKGAAIMSGARAAKNDLLVFIDADLEGFSKEVAEKLAAPLLNHECSICKSTYHPLEGRITDFTAKPLLKHIFSELELGQPLSGQFAIRKGLLLGLDVDTGWGIDIAIILSALKAGEKIVEVNIGEIEHKHREHASKIRTAEEVSRTILQQAGFLARKHRLVAFDFDGTLTESRSIDVIARKFGFLNRLRTWRAAFLQGRMSEKRLTASIAKALKGTNIAVFESAAGEVKKRRFAEETLIYLRRMGYKIALISYAYDRIISSVFRPQLFDFIICPKLEVAENEITGMVEVPKFPHRYRLFHKGRALKSIMRQLALKPAQIVAVGDSEGDREMYLAAHTSVTLSKKRRNGAKESIDSLPDLLIISS
ncbi:MAG: HAD-IB family phosphatase [Candidatus Micrarchaeia archaeon]